MSLNRTDDLAWAVFFEYGRLQEWSEPIGDSRAANRQAMVRLEKQRNVLAVQPVLKIRLAAVRNVLAIIPVVEVGLPGWVGSRRPPPCP